MPVIKSYERQISAPKATENRAITPSQLGAENAQASAELGKAISNTGEFLLRRKEQSDVSNLQVKMSEAQLEAANEYDTIMRTTAPGDTKPFEDYQRKIEDKLSKISEGVGTRAGREFYTESATKLKGHYQNAAIQGQAQLAGIKGEQDYLNVRNNLGSALLKDPNLFDKSVNDHKTAIQNLVNSGLLPAKDALKLERDGNRELVKATITGWAGINPEYAKTKVMSGELDAVTGPLDPELKVQLLGEVDRVIRARQVEDERIRSLNERIAAEKRETLKTEFLERAEKGELSTRDILNSNLLAAEQEHYIKYIDMQNRGSARDNPAVENMLLRRILLPDGDPEKIYSDTDLNPYVGKGLGLSGLNRLRNEINNSKSYEGKNVASLKKLAFDSARSVLTKSDPLRGIQDPDGDANYSDYVRSYNDEFARLRKEGIPAIDIIKDPKYLGNYVDKFRKTPQQIRQAMRDRIRPKPPEANADGIPTVTVPKRNPGETLEDYTKRVNEAKKKETK